VKKDQPGTASLFIHQRLPRNVPLPTLLSHAAAGAAVIPAQGCSGQAAPVTQLGCSSKVVKGEIFRFVPCMSFNL